MLSLLLNTWGNEWGAPAFWAPDEIAKRAEILLFTRNVNPHRFVYGGLHYYQLAVGAALPVWTYEKLFDRQPAGGSAGLEPWRARHFVRLARTSRTISAILTSLLVLVVFAVGSLLFSKRVGLLAAVFTALSPGLVVIAHFATVDAAANFWYWLACLLALLSWRRGESAEVERARASEHLRGRRVASNSSTWYALAAIAAGLAVGTKLDRIVIVIPLLVTLFLRNYVRRGRELITAGILFLLAFIAVNPTLIIAPFEFLDGTAREMFYSMMYPAESALEKLQHIGTGVGWPLLAAALLGTAVAAARLSHHAKGSAGVWLLATFFPYVLVYAFSTGIERYATLLFPGLALLAAVGIASLLGSEAPLLRRVGLAAAAFVVGWGLIQSLAVDLQFKTDPRHAAVGWIDQNAAPGSRIGTYVAGPDVDTTRYRVAILRRPLVNLSNGLQPAEALKRSASYQKVRRAILGAEAWAGRTLGAPVRREPYESWFDHSRGRPPGDRPGPIPEVDFLVVTTLHAETLPELQSNPPAYRRVRRLEPAALLGLRPRFEFLAPPLLIFERNGRVARELP